MLERRAAEFSGMTEAQWQKIAPLLPKSRKNRKGDRPWIENHLLEGFSGFCRARKMTGLAGEISASFDRWRRLRDWEAQGVWLKVWRAFLSELNERQQVQGSELFLDGSFAPARKGAAESKKPSGERDEGWWWPVNFCRSPRRRQKRIARFTTLDLVLNSW